MYSDCIIGCDGVRRIAYGETKKTVFSRAQLMQISPATHIEYCQACEVQSCVVYSDPMLNNCITMINLNISNQDAKLVQWIFRITFISSRFQSIFLKLYALSVINGSPLMMRSIIFPPKKKYRAS